MEQKVQRIEYRFGKAGSLAPLVAAAVMIMWAAISQSNVNGYVLAFFAALLTGVVFAKDEKAYGEALVYGLGQADLGQRSGADDRGLCGGGRIYGEAFCGGSLSHHLSFGICHGNFSGNLFCCDSDLISGGCDGRCGAGIYDRRHCVGSSLRR